MASFAGNLLSDLSRKLTVFKLAGELARREIDSRPVSAATLSFGTTPPDPYGSRHSRRSAPRQGSLPCSVDRWREVTLLFTTGETFANFMQAREIARAALHCSQGTAITVEGSNPGLVTGTPRSCRELHH